MLFTDQAREKGLHWVSVPDTLNVMLVGDRHRLLQVLANLVSNALKFTPEGTITLRGAVERAVGTALRIRFEVSDTGIGIPADKQDMIFDAFTQADSSMTRRYGGTGLGLSIARQLCHMMDGDIGVESVVGVGSTFWFTVLTEHMADAALPDAAAPATQDGRTAPLPAMQPSTSPASVCPPSRDFRAALERAGRSAVSILLVEDNSDNMRVTQALLETLGCRVTPARNGLEAVGHLPRQPIRHRADGMRCRKWMATRPHAPSARSRGSKAAARRSSP